MASLSQWWLSPVWEIDTGFDDQFNTTLLQEIAEVGRWISSGIDSNAKTSLWDYSKPNLDILKKYILEKSYELVFGDIEEVKDLNIKLEYSLGWVNVKGPGESIEAHGHNDCSLVATYYVKAPKYCGDMVIHSTRHMMDSNGLFNGDHGHFKHIEPQDGKLVIFPSYVLHEVMKNESEQLRVSISTDMRQVVDADAPNAMVIKSWCDAMKSLRNV
jgi:uncharacterized protein (TIGR02466 family)